MDCVPTAAFAAGLSEETPFRRFWPGSESTYSELLTRYLCAIIGAIKRFLPDLRLPHSATADSLGRQPGSVRHAMAYPCLGVDGRGNDDPRRFAVPCDAGSDWQLYSSGSRYAGDVAMTGRYRPPVAHEGSNLL